MELLNITPDEISSSFSTKILKNCNTPPKGVVAGAVSKENL
jgi:hypothetical protein